MHARTIVALLPGLAAIACGTEQPLVQPDWSNLCVSADGVGLPTPQTFSAGVAFLTAEQAGSGSASTASASPTPAQPYSDQYLGKAVSTLNFDRPLPAAPAFVALGVTPETVNNPATPREFAASLVNGVDRNGTLQTGLAVELAPYQVFFGPQTSLADYRQNFFTRLLYNTNFSLGTTKASTNGDKAQRLAFGIEFTLFDKGDPRLDPRVEKVFREVTDKIPPYTYDIDLSESENAAASKAHYEALGDPNKAYINGLDEIRAASWGKTAWNIAWAPTWVSATGKAGDLKYEGSTFWTTFAYGFEDVSALEGRVQFIAHVRYRQNEEVMDPNNSTLNFSQDSLFAAGRLRWGRADLNFSAEAAYIRIWNGPHGDGDGFRAGAVLEKKLATNFWLVFSAGEDFGAAGMPNNLFGIGSLRFGSADAPTFKQ